MKRKLDLIRAKNSKGDKLTFSLDNPDQVEATKSVQKSIEDLYRLINDKEDYDFDKLADQLDTLNSKLSLSEELKDLKQTIIANKVEPIDTVNIADFTKLLKAVESNKPLPIDLKPLEKAIIQVQQRVSEIPKVPEQAPDSYQPVRRVIKLGNRLVFDDIPTPSSRSGGGGGLSDQGAGSVRFAEIDVSSNGANTVIGAQTGLKIKVLSAVLVAADVVSVTWRSASTDLSGAIPLIANSGYVLPASSPSAGEYLQTAVGEALVINLSTGVQVSGHMTYYLA